MRFIILLFLAVNLTNAQTSYSEVSNPDKKIRGKFDSYTAYNDETYKVGDKFNLQIAANNGVYLSVFRPGLMMSYSPENFGEIIEILKFKAQHTMGYGYMYAIAKGENENTYQIAFDEALRLKEIKKFSDNIQVKEIYDEMNETTTYETTSVTIAYKSQPYLDFDIRKLTGGKYYLRVLYRSRYDIDGCFRKNDKIQIKTDKYGIIELNNVLETVCGDTGVLAYEIPKNLLEKLSSSNWTLMRVHHSEMYLEYKPDGNDDYFAQISNAILKY
ncbi:hypothetical protein BUL40_00310 [Croceivirga radicis]|uniref:Uncharacterized protein n=1 Tax=Croceivirga radicis TaxID=1929488 RepID=A0A1V6LV27_9FLAO|nr:hypothetical protein [Croceivirga radicis]OQD44034.1 hypothetical protein BUL40_00310 [Croceivirga radicis]